MANFGIFYVLFMGANSVGDIRMSMVYGWNDTNSETWKYSENNLSERHFVHQNSHMDWSVSAVTGRRLTAWVMAQRQI
jgi:hypothetical protein